MPTNTVQDRTLLAALRNGKQAVIQWLDTTVPVGTAGQFTEINLTGFTISFSGNRLNITSSGGGGSQAGIQFQDEGVDLGTPGTVDTVDFVGPNVIATRVGNVVTVTVSVTPYSPPVTTKGDLFGFSTVPDRVPVGSNNQFLVADSAQALGVKYTNISGGISFRIGRKDGAVLLPAFQRVFILPASYDSLATWELAVYPAATCQIDVQYLAFGASQPTTANSIVGGAYPTTAAGTSATGTTAGWTNTAPSIDAFIAIYIRSNDLAREIIFQVKGRRIP